MKNAGDVFLEVVVFVELNEIHISVPVCPGQEVLVKVFGNAGVCECPMQSSASYRSILRKEFEQLRQ